MKTFLIVSLCIMALAFLSLYLVSNWKRWIWENKGRVFRIRTYGRYWEKDKPFWVAEKRFLWFYVNCNGILHAGDFYTKEDAIKCVSDYAFLQLPQPIFVYLPWVIVKWREVANA